MKINKTTSIAGYGIENLIAQIWSKAIMLEYLSENKAVLDNIN